MSSELQLDVCCHSCCGGDIRWTHTKERQAWCYLQVKLCDPRLSALSVVATIKALYKYTSFLSFLEAEAIVGPTTVAENYTLEVGIDQQEILRYWTKCAFFRIIYSLLAFSLYYVRTPWVDAPNFVPCFNAFIVDERCIFVCPYVEPLRIYVLPIHSGSAKY